MSDESNRPRRRPAARAVEDSIARRIPGEGGSRVSHATLVEGAEPQFSGETNALRRSRLRAAALSLSVGLSLALIRDRLIGGGVAWQLHVASILALAVILALLSAPRPFTARRLRGAEITLFGLTAAVLAVRQYHAMRLGFESGDVVAVASGVKNALFGSTLLMFAYTMLIPNTWRGAGPFVLGIAACPIATEGLFLLTHPAAFELKRRLLVTGGIGENFLMLLSAALLSVFGVHLINALRREAFEARQFNQYRLGERIGAGGMGEVYKAEHQLLKRPCAIKLIRPERAGDPQSLARFEREVRATARLSHPNTVEIFDFGRAEDGTLFYVMEFLHGLSFAELVEDHGPLPPGRIIFLLRQVCEALAEAHEVGLIHRDLKPANLFAARRGGRYDFVKLLDFGLVKDLAGHERIEVSREATIRGTPHYIAPEQASGDRALDHRCDLYSLGAVAFTLLTGRPPFEGDIPARVMIAHVRDPVVPPSKIRPDVPEDLERVIMRCLEKRPAERYQSADELEEALAGCADAPRWDVHKAARWWREFEEGEPIAPTA